MRKIKTIVWGFRPRGDSLGGSFVISDRSLCLCHQRVFSLSNFTMDRFIKSSFKNGSFLLLSLLMSRVFNIYSITWKVEIHSWFEITLLYLRFQRSWNLLLTPSTVTASKRLRFFKKKIWIFGVFFFCARLTAEVQCRARCTTDPLKG